MTKKDLEFKYYLLRNIKPERCDNPAKAFEGLLKIKSEIRRYFKRESERDPVTCIKDDPYGYYTLLIKLPEYIKDAESAEYYFMNNYYMEYVPSQYDCTGQHFTQWYKIVKRSYGYVAFHHVAVDI